jgi:hypothetical protein
MVAGRLTGTKKQLRKLIVGAVAATVVMALVGHAAAAEAMQADINGPFGLPTVAISAGQWSTTWRSHICARRRPRCVSYRLSKKASNTTACFGSHVSTARSILQ